MTAPVRDYPKLAHDIITLVGGPSNITGITRCATRLRLVLKSTPEDAHTKIENLPGVITTVEKGGQFQIVIGNRVGEVYEAAIDQLGIDPNEQQIDDEDNKPTLMNRIIAMMSAVFAPSFTYSPQPALSKVRSSSSLPPGRSLVRQVHMRFSRS